jgi:hypothetical protein
MFKILAKSTEILAQFQQTAMDLAKAKKWQMAIGYRYYVTTRAVR